MLVTKDWGLKFLAAQLSLVVGLGRESGHYRSCYRGPHRDFKLAMALHQCAVNYHLF